VEHQLSFKIAADCILCEATIWCWRKSWESRR